MSRPGDSELKMARTMLSRRKLLQRAVLLGATAPVLGTLLSACGEADDDDVDPVDDVDDDEPDPVDDDVDDEDVDPVDDPDDDDADAVDEPDDDDSEPVDDEERYGGRLEVALIGEPPTLDVHQTTATVVGHVTWHIYEPLFTWDADFELMPELAESHEVSDDGLTNTVRIRDGITFHNGEELTPADVIASIERWGGIGGPGATLLASTEEISEVDELTIEFRMNEPLGIFTTLLARQPQGCGIYPQSVIESVGDEPLNEYIGTGPYQFVEHQPDQHVRLERFDDYVSQSGEPSGYGGTKYQYLDEINFIPVPDEAARVAGLQAGDYHLIDSMSSDHLETLEGDPDVVAEALEADGIAAIVLNTSEGPLANVDLRRAVQAALDHEPIMQAGYGDGFFVLDPSPMLPVTPWHSSAGEDLYNQNDPETAQQWMEDAEYDDTPIRVMTTQEYQHFYNMSAVTGQQLEDAGFAVDVQVYDWSTLVDRRANPEDWDIFITDGFFRVDPAQLPFVVSCDWPGWWCSDEKVSLTEELLTESDQDQRLELWNELQQQLYDDAALIILGNRLPIGARSPRIQNFETPLQIQFALWNLWLED